MKKAFIVVGSNSWGRSPTQPEAQSRFFTEAKDFANAMGGWVKGTNVQANVYEIDDDVIVAMGEDGCFARNVEGETERLKPLERITFDCDTGQITETHKY